MAPDTQNSATQFVKEVFPSNVETYQTEWFQTSDRMVPNIRQNGSNHQTEWFQTSDRMVPNIRQNGSKHVSVNRETLSTRSPFLSLLPRRAQYGRCFSFGKRAWFIESHIVLFTQFIVDKLKKKRAVSS